MTLDTKNTTVEPYLKQHHMEVTKDTARASIVQTKLLHNTFEFGVPYCPCQSQHTPDTICPCKYMRKAGACRCGLFVKEAVNHGNG